MTSFQRFLAGALLLCMPSIVVAQEPSRADQTALEGFHDRIAGYAALHRRLEEGLPPINSDRTMRSYLLNRVYLAAAIKAARPHARQGDFFTPQVAPLLRRIIAESLAGEDVEEALRELPDEGLAGGPPVHPKVYDAFPDWAPHSMPVVLLSRLPALQDDVQYRIVDRDLVLLDTHANLIIDVLPDAFAPPHSFADAVRPSHGNEPPVFRGFAPDFSEYVIRERRPPSTRHSV